MPIRWQIDEIKKKCTEKNKIRKAKIGDLRRIRAVTRQAYKVPIKKGGLTTKATEPKDLEFQLRERRTTLAGIGVFFLSAEGKFRKWVL